MNSSHRLNTCLAGLFLSASLLISNASAQGTYTVGIPTENLNICVSSQRSQNWCWAACVQTVLNYWGVAIDQEQVVARTVGGIVDIPGSIQQITANLNNWSIDNFGRTYGVQSTAWNNPPDVNLLLSELNQGFPVLVGYRSSSDSGHAVLITAATYSMTPNGPSLHSVVVRDPYPSQQNMATLGRTEYDAASFYNRIYATWYIRAQAY